jgi:DNA-binding transcriptional MerR regulator
MRTNEVAKLTGASLRQLQTWDETGLLPASINPQHQNFREYLPADVLDAHGIMACLRAGASLVVVRKMREVLGSDFGPWCAQNKRKLPVLFLEPSVNWDAAQFSEAFKIMSEA